MKKIGCLNSELSYVIAKLGHFDTLTVGDCGLPVPQGVQRIDLAVTYGVPSFEQVFSVIDQEAKFQKAIIAQESIEQNPEKYGALTLEEAKEYGFDPEEYKNEPDELKKDVWAEAETSWIAEETVRR